MKRTKKEFTPYNEYHDRPFELKWATAFALGELQEGIEASDEYSKRAFERLPQQTTEEIEEYLEQSLKNNQVLEILEFNWMILAVFNRQLLVFLKG
ncbi:hypothetical protein HMPREF9520_02081 [Enterococcus faecalis TX1467]|nr:hypothetical protein HMPREF9520_02081 [Enterococcus faecalis TX1467]